MERIKLKNGTVWPDPTGEKFKDIIWRFRHVQDSIEPSDLLCAAEIIGAYSNLITHPAFTLKEVNARISEIRKIIKKNQK